MPVGFWACGAPSHAYLSPRLVTNILVQRPNDRKQIQVTGCRRQMSRSGATICTSLFLGNKNRDSAEFSFLIVIPVIFGAILKDVITGDIFSHQLKISVLVIGFSSSFLFGIMACKWMLKIVNNNNLIYFSYYCFIMGIISIYIL